MNRLLKEAIRLRKEDKLKESNKILMDLVKKYPNDGIVNYQCAWSFDILEMEREAISFYEKAIKIGLPKEDLKEAYLGLGSTYRTIGEYEKSKKIFMEGIEKFDINSLKVFLAMTLYNLGEHSKSMEILLKIISETSCDKDIVSFKRAIDFYSDKLDKLW
ncbi:MAG: tetratricopeptide repeat protein [Peptostreptococcaceae bacterium]|jgi:tetratricopeptide (TPR) repeat protein|nr:tetratricopeptide repeat protein [Peptostreptococcaceae bacterium]